MNVKWQGYYFYIQALWALFSRELNLRDFSKDAVWEICFQEELSLFSNAFSFLLESTPKHITTT